MSLKKEKEDKKNNNIEKEIKKEIKKRKDIIYKIKNELKLLFLDEDGKRDFSRTLEENCYLIFVVIFVILGITFFSSLKEKNGERFLKNKKVVSKLAENKGLVRREIYDIKEFYNVAQKRNIYFKINLLKKKLWKTFTSPFKFSKNPSRLLEEYLWNNIFVKYQGYKKKISLADLKRFSDKVKEYYIFEFVSGQLNTNAIRRYYLYKDYWEQIFSKNLANLIGKERAKDLILMGFVESYFGCLNNNYIAKGPYQFTYSTGRLYGLVGKDKDLRNHFLLSAEAASKLLRDNILRVLVYKGKISELKKYVRDNKIYIVKKGDTLKEIGEKFGYTSEFIKVYNGLKSDMLKVGQRLFIPNLSEKIKELISDDDIFLALEMYNGGLIVHFRKFPSSIEEYDTLLKDLYLEYKFVLERYKDNVKCLKTKLKSIESKYFKAGYSLVFRKNLKLKKKPSKLLDFLGFIIFQQFKYPWKYWGAEKFFSFIDSNIGDEKYILIDKTHIFSNLNVYLPVGYRFNFKYFFNVSPINIEYNGETFDELVGKYYKKVLTGDKKKFVKDKIYIVKRGDVLFRIWERYVKSKSISFKDFLKVNRLNSKSIIRPGDKLVIPKIKLVSKKLVSKSLFKKRLERIILKELIKQGIIEEDHFYIYKKVRRNKRRYLKKIGIYMYFLKCINNQRFATIHKIGQELRNN